MHFYTFSLLYSKNYQKTTTTTTTLASCKKKFFYRRCRPYKGLVFGSASPKPVNAREATHAHDKHQPGVLTCIPNKQLKFHKSQMGLLTTGPTPRPRVSLSLQDPKFHIVQAKIRESALVSLFPLHPTSSSPGSPIDGFQNTPQILAYLGVSMTLALRQAAIYSHLDDCICFLPDLHASNSSQMHN